MIPWQDHVQTQALVSRPRAEAAAEKPDQRVVVQSLLIGALVALFGLWRARYSGAVEANSLVALGLGVAAGLYRLEPAWALAMAWLSNFVHVTSGLPVTYVQFSVVIVAYGAARYGRAATVWASGLSLPVGAFCALVYVQYASVGYPMGLDLRSIPGLSTGGRLSTELLLAGAVLAGPWALGLLLRLNDRYRESSQGRTQAEEEAERAQAEAQRVQEVADLRADQARLARDVHDVVGHSLAVIVAQADSVQFLGDDLPKIREAVANIAASARQSLGDVREVLTSTGDDGTVPARRAGGLDELITGVRTSGHELTERMEGVPQPLPPDLDAVAYRVLQEMLTNALKHGRRDRPITVERLWGPDALRLEVRNVVNPDALPTPDGLGLVGMQRRLESVGGRLHVRREESDFTATAWVPLRATGAPWGT